MPGWSGPSIPWNGRSTIYGAPVYVRHEIVHNRYVVDSLKTKGAIFVEELAEIPDNTNAPVVFSAHGVPKSVPADASARNFFSLDATCPLVTKVHREAAIHFKRGREILLIGHSHHPEVVGTLGQLPVGAVTLIETAEDAKTFTPKDPDNLAFVTQTTLSIDDTAEIVAMLKERFPNISGPHKEDICYATTNRQLAVKKVAPVVDALIVVGAPNSSNSQRLREVAEREGCPIAVLAQRATDIDWTRFEGIKSLGITAGASAPEVIVEEIMGAFAERYHAACGDGLGRGRERVLPAAALAAPRSRRRVGPSWRFTPTLPPKTLRNSSKRYDIGELLSYKGIAEGVENSNFLLHTSKGAFILTLYEKRVAVDDLPFFLSLMAHLAERGVSCPQPVKNRRRRGAARACGPAGGDHQFSRRRVAAPAERRALRRRRRGAGQDASGRRAISRCPRQPAVGRGLAAAVRRGRAARRQVAARPARISSRANSIISRAGWPQRSAARRHPCRSVSRQRVLPRRQAVGPDRLPVRLQRHPGLRRRDLPQRLVLRAGSFLQRHQGARAAQRLWPRAAAVRGRSRTRCRCWRAARRCASC